MSVPNLPARDVGKQKRTQSGLLQVLSPIPSRITQNVVLKSCPTRARTPAESKLETVNRQPDDAHSDARRGEDADLDRLAELWPKLVSDDRLALLAQAEHLAALRDGATGETSSR